MTEHRFADVVVTTADLYSVPNYNGKRGFCARGARAWFGRHGIDWTEFVRKGVPASALIATGDAMARRLVEHALNRRGPDGR